MVTAGTSCLKMLGFQQLFVNACDFRLVEKQRVVIIVAVHFDSIFAVGLTSKCDVV